MNSTVESRWHLSGGRMVSVVLAAILVCSLALLAPIARLSRPAAGRSLPVIQVRVVREAAYPTDAGVVITGTVMNSGSNETGTNLVTAVIAGRDRASLGMQSVELGPLRSGRWKDFRIEFSANPDAVVTYDVWTLTR